MGSFTSDFASKCGYTCLGYLGLRHTNRTNHLCVASPKVAKVSTAKTATVAVMGSFTSDFASNSGYTGFTFLGYLGQCYTKRTNPIFVISTKVAKASTTSAVTVAVMGSFASDFASKHGFTCLGYLGRWHTNRTNPLCVASPKVAKASKAKTATVAVMASFTSNFTSKRGYTCLGYLVHLGQYLLYRPRYPRQVQARLKIYL
jgi:hypothetical protein